MLHFFQNLWHFFEHVIETKSHVIESLLKELDESEEQYARNFQSHAETIDQLVGMYVCVCACMCACGFFYRKKGASTQI
jgi:hypothetical protein